MLDRWLGLARANRDTRLVRQLLAWKYAGKGWEIDGKRWNQALIAEFAAAPTPAARTIVLDEFDIWFHIDERTAVSLYEIDKSSPSPASSPSQSREWKTGTHPRS